MTGEQVRSQAPPGEAPTTAEMIDRLSRFEGPPEQFLVNLLAVQCRLAPAQAGAILRPGPEGQAEVLSVFPPMPQGSSAPAWLSQAAGVAARATEAGTTVIHALSDPDALYGEPARRQLVLLPMARGEAVRGLAVYLTEVRSAGELAGIQQRLELSVSLLSLYEMRVALQRRAVDMQRLRVAMETLSAVNESGRFTGAAMALCNEIASRWDCDRVSMGFHEGRYVELKAMSHTEKFSRKMKLVQNIESAMEDCLDQDIEVLHPAAADAVYVSRATGELSNRQGPAAIVSLPLRHDGDVVAVATLERPTDNPFAVEDIETLRLTLDLCAPRLVDLYEHDRWIGARMARGLRKGLAWVVGPKHTWWKVAAIAIAAALVFLIFFKGPYRADASFTVEAVQRQIVPAPFDGYLKQVHVDPGDVVQAGKTVLATLDTAELKEQLYGAEVEKRGYLKQAAAAMRDGKTVDKVDATIRLLTFRISKSQIISDISGCVVTGDLKRQIGAPVKTGDVLFEVAPLAELRAGLSVPEDQIAEVRDGSKGGEPSVGKLATASYPDMRMGFVVERITPVAEVVDQKNVFKVRVQLTEPAPPWLRPGMAGTAKIDLGRRRYMYLVTRKLVNWLRMKLWL